MSGQGPYQLARRNRGGLVLGMPAPQAALVATGVAILLVLTMLTQSLPGFMVGALIATCCTGVAFIPLDGQPAHLILPALLRFIGSRIGGSGRWLAPLPPTATGIPASQTPGPSAGQRSVGSFGQSPARTSGRNSRTKLRWPRCLTGLDVVAAPRPAWAGTGAAGEEPVGLVQDSRTGTLTVVMPVRGGSFSLQDTDTQHAQLAGWGQVLTQFARESSPVARLGWSLWSSPGMNGHHFQWLHQQNHLHTGQREPLSDAPGDAADPHQRAVQDYWQVLRQQAPRLYQHELRVWITVDTRHRASRRSNRTQVALAAGQALSERCSAAGLMPMPPLSPTQLIEALRDQADPETATARRRTRAGLAQRTGLLAISPRLPAPTPPPRPSTPAGDGPDFGSAAPLALATHWDAVQVDSSWHRSFWVAHWPAGVHDPRWLEPLLLTPVGTRAISVTYEPISPRTSRRRVTADAVALDSQLQLRDKHEFRVPVHLRAAHDEIDQRESELSAGYTEYGHLTLITVTAPTLDDLDQDCQTLLDQAAQCGVTELRPLHGRHDAAWACTLPIGRAPDHELMNGAGL